MKKLPVIIIHNSGIVQAGLKNILLNKNFIISDILDAYPERATISKIREHIFFIDEKFGDFLKNDHIHFLKNKNKIVFISYSEQSLKTDINPDEILYISDTNTQLNDKLFQLNESDFTECTNNQLSSREMDILKLVATGMSNKEISKELFISIHTVMTHRKNITAKLGIKTIAGLTLYASINNIL